ncbi:MAG: hypothetical protein HZB41_07845 [Ignavibacteriae bacterium]|nr:hypothetical protein [Ignavibacteriota bacterium]
MPSFKRHTLCLIFLLMFPALAITAFAQVDDNSLDYILARKTPGIHNYIFINSQPAHNGTEIAQTEKKKTVNTKKIEEDTSNARNSITIRESTDGERMLVCLDLNDYDVNVEIIVYNMLGKKVMDVWNGKAISSSPCPKDYEIQKTKLPDGLYLCVAQSEKFRMVGKFVISR